MLSSKVVIELACWTPPIVLILLWLGLIAARSISRPLPWAGRLVAPPFHFVSLPIATLIAGMEMLIWVFHDLSEFAGMIFDDRWRDAISFVLYLLMFALISFPFASFVLVMLGYTLFAALAFSGAMLGIVLLHGDDWTGPASKKSRRLVAMGLLAAFLWTWASSTYAFTHWESPINSLMSNFFKAR